MDGLSYAETPLIIGLPQGMGAFHVQIGGESLTRDGWSGSLAQMFPTFWVVGGNHSDAIENALTVTRLSNGTVLESGATVTRIHITVTDCGGESFSRSYLPADS